MKKKLFSLLLLSFFLIGSFCSAWDLVDYHLWYRGTISWVFKPWYSYIISPLDSYMQDSTLRLTCYTWYNETKYNCWNGCSFDIDSLLAEGCSSDSFILTCYESPCNFSLESVSPPLLPWWQQALSWVVSNLTNSVNEFIPLIVYIWIWIIFACIWFVSIKRLINWVRWKTLTPFK